MDFKSYVKIFLEAVFLFFAPVLYAQDDGFFIDTSTGEPRLFQRLSWSQSDNLLYYEVLIQKESPGGFVDFLRETTKEEFIVVSLSHGNYQYRVTPYNLFGLPGESSEWRPFSIIPAYMPLIESFQPSAFYMENRMERILEIEGNNFLEESEIYLIGDNNNLYPVDKTILDSRRATLVFDDDTLVPGRYVLYVKNPGGLETVMPGFFVGYRRPVNIVFKAAWMPVIPVFGNLKNNFDSNFSFTGMTLSFGATSSRRGFITEGFEFMASVYALDSANIFDFGKIWDSGAMVAELMSNLILQRRFFNNRLNAVFRIGGGVGFISGFGDYRQTDIFLCWNAGFSSLMLLGNVLYLDAGIDYTNHHSEVMAGFIKPRIGLCWIF
jgi:hypothetical protein